MKWCSFTGTSPQNQTFQLRRPRSHSQQVTFASYYIYQTTIKTIQLKSRPTRENWTMESMKLAWDILKANDVGSPNLNFDHRILVIREALLEPARDHKPPFNWSQIVVWLNSFWTILCVNTLYVKCLCMMRRARKHIIIYQNSFVEWHV